MPSKGISYLINIVELEGTVGINLNLILRAGWSEFKKIQSSLNFDNNN